MDSNILLYHNKNEIIAQADCLRHKDRLMKGKEKLGKVMHHYDFQ